MPRQLLQTPDTFTSERVRCILNDGSLRLDTETGLGTKEDEEKSWMRRPVEFLVCRLKYEHRTEEGLIISHRADARRERATTLCKTYVSLLHNPSDHLERLDAAFSELVTCNFYLVKPPEEIIQQACGILTRLPEMPSEFYQCRSKSYSQIRHEYFCTGQERRWETLKVVQFVDTVTIRLALRISMNESIWEAGVYGDLLNTIAELLEAAINVSKLETSAISEWFLLKAFLWTAWQRCLMLHFFYVLNVQLSIGYDSVRNKYLTLRGASIVRDNIINMSAARKGRQEQDPKIAPYMCRWALELLRTDRASMALDFRHLHERYSDLFGNRQPRCIKTLHETTQPCEGDSPYKCTRFQGLKIDDQSAHTANCAGNCDRLFWNEDSYRKTQGARAVNLGQVQGNLLGYCTASSNTMAISHVWSHGQGGRPELGETGFNRCLHNRYSTIAQSFGCDSYWMDTPCIPQDHQLRLEAIRKINSVFAGSKLTLICDRDLMDIDIENLTIDLQESILATLLVCDWNVRAWTLLEAMRARHNVHLLFRNNKVLPAKTLLENLCREGSIDLVILSLTSQHLIPAQSLPSLDISSPAIHDRAKGYVRIEEAACLLNHRHASRLGDEVMIWSLLCGEAPFDNAVDLWKSRVQKRVLQSKTFWPQTQYIINSAFLVSTTPRLKNAGMSWAPCRPDLSQEQYESRQVRHVFAYDGQGSQHGFIRENGYEAEWLVREFDGGLEQPVYMNIWNMLASQWYPSTSRRLCTVARDYLQEYRWGALLLPASETGQSEGAVWHKGDSNVELLVVVGSIDRTSWHWIGLYDWEKSIPLPTLTLQKLLIT